MSSIPAGAVPITFAPDRTQIDNFLAELRRGYTVPLRFDPTSGPGGGNGGGSQFMPGSPRVPQWSPNQTAGNNTYNNTYNTSASTSQVNNTVNNTLNQLQQTTVNTMSQLVNNISQQFTAALQQQITNNSNVVNNNVVNNIQRGGGGGGGGRGAFGLGRLARIATAGFAVQEALGAAQTYEQFQTNMALSRNGIERAQAWMEVDQRVSSIPLIGQTYNLITSRQRRATELSLREADEGEKDYRNQLEINSIRRESRRSGIFSSYDRQVQAARDEFQDFSDSIADADDPRERARLLRRLPAERERRDSRIADLAQQRYLDFTSRQRLEGGLRAGAAGRFGEAGELTFEAGLRNDIQALVQKEGADSPSVRQQLINDDLRRQERQQRNQLRTRGIESENRALGLELGRNGLAAQRERVLGQMEDELAGATDPAQAFAISNQATLRLRALTQHNADNFRLDIGNIRARNESLDILVNGPGTPADRERASAIDSIRRRTQLQELAAFQDASLTPEQKLAKATALSQGGALELGAMREDFLKGLKPEEIDITRRALTGVGTEDAGQALQQIQKTIEELSKVPQKLDDIFKALGNLVAGP